MQLWPNTKRNETQSTSSEYQPVDSDFITTPMQLIPPTGTLELNDIACLLYYPYDDETSTPEEREKLLHVVHVIMERISNELHYDFQRICSACQEELTKKEENV